jgi:hypothetical protein
MFERNRHLARVCFENEGGQGQRRSSADVLQQYGNDAIRMADRVAELERDNYRYREQKRDLTDRVKALEGKQVPEGAVVLTGDDAQSWQAFSALGKPDEVKAKLAERDTLATEVATTRRDGLLRDAAQAAGFKFSVLKDRVALAGDLPIEVREVDENGTKVNRAFVKPQGGGEKSLTDYAAEHWADYLPALTATGGGDGAGQQGNGAGQVFPRQHGSSNQSPPANAARQHIQSTYQIPKPRTA